VLIDRTAVQLSCCPSMLSLALRSSRISELTYYYNCTSTAVWPTAVASPPSVSVAGAGIDLLAIARQSGSGSGQKLPEG
jgi:hypothetical protein